MRDIFRQIIVVLSTIAVIVVNGLATALPLNGLAGATGVYDERNQRALLFGGEDAGGRRSGLREINLYQPVLR